MKNLILVLFLAFYSFAGIAQPSLCPGSSSEDYSIRLESDLLGFEYNNPVKGYTGEQYFNLWTIGEVELRNGDVIKNISLKYDKYLDQLLWLRKKDSRIGIIAKDAISSFRLYNFQHTNELIAVFRQMKICVNGIDTTSVLLQELVPGERGLYVYRNVVIISSTEYKLEENTKYFIIYKGKQFPLKMSRYSLLRNPAIQKSEMKAIIRSEGLVFNHNEQVMARALQQYNLKHGK